MKQKTYEEQICSRLRKCSFTAFSFLTTQFKLFNGASKTTFLRQRNPICAKAPQRLECPRLYNMWALKNRGQEGRAFKTHETLFHRLETKFVNSL